MQKTFFKAIAGTDDTTGRGEVVVFAGGDDLDSLVTDLAGGIGDLMLKHGPSPHFGGEIRVVWIPDKLPNERADFADLQTRVCDQILQLGLAPAQDIKLSFQVGV